ncbi:MAG: DUF5331 domain-containing protein [Crocosphaera sp.]
MSEFEKLKATLNDKWLDYYQVNRSWIKKVLQNRNGTGDIMTSSLTYLILGVITAIEPKTKEFLDPFSELNPDALSLIRVLDLDYVDLDQKLKERAEKRAKNPQLNSSDTDEIERIRQQLSKGEL